MQPIELIETSKANNEPAQTGALIQATLATMPVVEADDRPEGFEREYTESKFWKKVKDFAFSAGSEVIEKALTLFYAAQSQGTPVWAKTVIYAALGYFILTFDAIPDVTPVVGFADDLGVLVAAIAAVAAYVRPELRDKAREKMKDWFGERVQ